MENSEITKLQDSQKIEALTEKAKEMAKLLNGLSLNEALCVTRFIADEINRNSTVTA